MNTRMLALAGVLLAAAPASAQRTISPGMTEAQVRTVLGTPATTRSTEGWTYLYYHNGCPNRCGSDDVVFLQDGRVVAAVFRTGARRFTGLAPDDALEQAGTSDGSAEIRRTGDAAEPAVVGRIRVRGEADEDRAPSVPLRVEAEDDGPALRERAAPAPAQPLRRAGSRESRADTVRAPTPTVIQPRTPADTTRPSQP